MPSASILLVFGNLETCAHLRRGPCGFALSAVYHLLVAAAMNKNGPEADPSLGRDWNAFTITLEPPSAFAALRDKGRA